MTTKVEELVFCVEIEGDEKDFIKKNFDGLEKFFPLIFKTCRDIWTKTEKETEIILGTALLGETDVHFEFHFPVDGNLMVSRHLAEEETDPICAEFSSKKDNEIYRKLVKEMKK
ncbi:hypothetical protein ES703_41656 [subsurface metagenome]